MYPQLCFAPEFLHVRGWPNEVLDQLGFDPRSGYVEDYWLGILGPSTVWLLRRLRRLRVQPFGLRPRPLRDGPVARPW